MHPLLDTTTRVRAETTQTWRVNALGDRPLRVLREAWPRVLPKCEGGSLEELPHSKGATRAWLEAIAAFDELSQYRDRDTLLRRSVELLRQPIGLERAAIFLLDARGDRLLGTWGTGAQGESTDERHIAFEVGSSHREAFAHARSGSAQWSRFSGVPLFAETSRGTIVVRSGENVIIPIPSGSGNLGLVACDWGLSGRLADAETLLRATVLTRVLSPLLQRLTTAVPSGSPVAAKTEHAARLAARAASALQADPAIDRAVLARRLGTAPGTLGRAFKAALGESLTDYRNRQRIQRFLAVVDPCGGNLLEAALEAGFGSYAQFHRVFRQSLGCSPIVYLRRMT
jgi:AraC-like DNA-binding protein